MISFFRVFILYEHSRARLQISQEALARFMEFARVPYCVHTVWTHEKMRSILKWIQGLTVSITANKGLIRAANKYLQMKSTYQPINSLRQRNTKYYKIYSRMSEEFLWLFLYLVYLLKLIKCWLFMSFLRWNR